VGVGTVWPVADEWLTVAEARGYLKVGTTTLYRWMSEGRLAYRELSSGGGRRVRKSDLEAMLQDPRARQERDVELESGGGPRWTRTTYLRVISTALCQLS
jgi:excisionase family DNA binding protein